MEKTSVTSQIADLQAQLEGGYPADEARSLAWWIAEEMTGLSRTQLLTGCKDTKKIANTQAIVERLLHFEPIQYIFGHTIWMGLDLKVTPVTLIPRPETAELVERINDQMRKCGNDPTVRVLDLCTGSGCIAIALKKAHPEWQVTGIDISAEAIEVARENARRNGVEVEFKVADIFDFNEEIFNSQFSIGKCPFDIVVSNPPYVTESEKSSMKPNVLDYEPSTALFVPDDDPLRFYRKIAELFSSPRREGVGRDLSLFFEINEHFSDEIEILLQSLGYQNIRIHRDIYGKPRIIDCRMS